MGNLFLELSVIIAVAAGLAIFFRFFKQPSILAYILTGVIIGPLSILHIENQDIIREMADIGITLLLFMLGLELRISELKNFGKVSVITGFGQILFTSVLGFFIAIALGFEMVPSVYIAIAMTFSSTIIIVKLLSDKRDLSSLYGRISVGFLLVQDFFAILALVFLSGFSSGELSPFSFIWTIVKAIIIFAVVIYLGRSILPKIVDKISHSSESLFLFSIAWVFVIAAVVSSSPFGFSIEIGGLLAGLALANSSESFQIAARTKPLRDFFITLFFISLGMGMVFSNFSEVLLPAVLFSVFILVGNPLIVMIILGILGYRKRTSFLAGLTVAQISEFSLVLMFSGQRLGHVGQDAVALVTMVGIVTFTGSSYMIMHGDRLYSILKPLLGIFERKNTHKEKTGEELNLRNHVVVIGANRSGRIIVDSLKKLGHDLIVVDFDPTIVSGLEDKNVNSLFGDIRDPDIQVKSGVFDSKLVISTVPDIEDNLALLHSLKKRRASARVIILAWDPKEAKMLYKAGADYVVMPHLTGAHHISKILKDTKIEDISELRNREGEML